MNSILDYAKSNLRKFNEYKLNDIDALILSWISYYHIPKELAKEYSKKPFYLKDFYNLKYLNNILYDVFDMEKSKELITYLAGNERFKDLEILYYVEQKNKNIEKQFSAMTFKLSKDEYLIAFRGTDHSFIGWKEDFNMCYKKSIPSQIEALKYLNKIFSKLKGKFYITGHSKGGNLSAYASSLCSVNNQNRILKVYNFDGPGLNNSNIKNTPNTNINIKIHKFVPQASIVGMCFENTTNYKIIKSNGIGILQHNPFTWEIKNNKFINAKSRTLDSNAFKKGLNNIINSLSEKEIKTFVNTLYNILNKTQMNDFDTLSKNILKNLPILFEGFTSLDLQQKKLLLKVAIAFIHSSKN